MQVQQLQREKYDNEIRNFKTNLSKYQKVASVTFLSSNTTGDRECFYDYMLYNYYPYLVQRIWKDYEVGIVMFNLQGFKHRNKESKNASK